jgi:hypothetical protein
LGLKVRTNELQRTARDGNVLQMAQIEVATNCNVVLAGPRLSVQPL